MNCKPKINFFHIISFVLPNFPGALATLYEVAVFQPDVTLTPFVGDWRFTDVKVGSYVTYGGSLYFSERDITVIKAGLYTISVNLDVEYSKWEEVTTFKLSVCLLC